MRNDAIRGIDVRAIFQRALVAGAVLALAACGSGGGSGSAPGGSSGGGSSGGSTQGPYFVMGDSGTQRTNNTVTFVNVPGSIPVGANPFDLQEIDPAGGTVPAATVMGGNWLPLAEFSQWSATGGSATQWGLRYVVYSDTAGNFKLADLKVPSGTARPAVPGAPVALAGGLTASMVCPAVPSINDYADATNSILVFRNPGTNLSLQDCGSADDEFYALKLNATSAPTLGFVEPVEALRDGTGAITTVFSIVHPSTYTSSGAPIGAVTLQQSAADLVSSVVAIGGAGGTLSGTGTNAGGSRDFQTLGTTATAWFFRDVNSVVAVTGGATPTGTLAFTSSGAIQAPAWFDATSAYLAISGNTSVGSSIIKIDLGTLAATILVTEPAPAPGTSAPGISIAGLTANSVVYWMTDGSAVKSIAKTAIAGTGTVLSTGAITGSMVLSAIYGGYSAPLVVTSGSTSGVYFSVCDCAGFSAAPQVWFSTGAGAPVKIGNGLVLSGVVPSPAVNANPSTPVYGSVILATGVTASTSPMTNVFSAATIAEYGPTGAVVASYGQLSAPSSGNPMGLAEVSDGTIQSGMPALLIVGGTSQNGNSVQDLWQFLPGTAGSLARKTNNL